MQTHSAATASSNVMPASCPCPHGRMWVMFSFYGVPPVWLQVALTTQVRRAVTATVMAVDIPEPIDYFQTLHDDDITYTLDAGLNGTSLPLDGEATFAELGILPSAHIVIGRRMKSAPR